MQCFIFKPQTPECNKIRVSTPVPAAASAPWCLPGDPTQPDSPAGTCPIPVLHHPGEAALPSRFLQEHKEGFPSPGGLSFSPAMVPIHCPVTVTIAEVRSFTQAGRIRFSPFFTVMGVTHTSCHPISSPVENRNHQGKASASSLPGGQSPGYLLESALSVCYPLTSQLKISKCL